MKYTVIVTETLSQKVKIEAESEADALEIAEEMYYDSDIILDCDDFVCAEFEID